ncbi:Tat binding protein 1-interacting [Delitschia confertaspora ATCC 74209]|uniref:Tat binding protein 1-interacting n=1 Tax=Delitschia confertaspora ATCC 74209 TaxID=1513339 RepID=A0A9P4JMN7_9PLEO|nr:Tat binding protein 1-interacting [Delitschia confertaspora ATCC 74209]
MAPRKEKVEKVSADEAADTMLRYLRKQNRPYSASDISANLHNKVTKAAAAKILKDLHERREIEGRAAGKQIVYHALQDPTDGFTAEQSAGIDERIKTLRAETTAALTTAKTLRSTLSSINSTLSTADLFSSISTLETEKAEITERLKTLKEGKAKKVTSGEKNRIEKEWKMWKGIAGRREKIVKEVWRVIEDVLPEGMEKGEVRENLGLDE